MKVKAVRPFRWAGDHVEAGSLLTVTPEEAHRLVHVYRDCVFVEDATAPEIRHADPVVEHRDPVESKRRRR